MSNYEDFFDNSHPEGIEEQPVIPSSAITEPLGNVLPNTIYYPQVVKYCGAYAIDSLTNMLYVNTNAEVGPDDQFIRTGSRLPIMRILAIDNDEIIDGFIVDARDTSAVTSLSKEYVTKINETAIDDLEHDWLTQKEQRFYVPALAVVHETAGNKLRINGDQRLKGFGLGFIIAVNSVVKDNLSSYEPKPQGTYTISANDTGKRQDSKRTPDEPVRLNTSLRNIFKRKYYFN